MDLKLEEGNVVSTARWVGYGLMDAVENDFFDLSKLKNDAGFISEHGRLMSHLTQLRFTFEPNHPHKTQLLQNIEPEFGLLGFTLEILRVEAELAKNHKHHIAMFVGQIMEELTDVGVGHKSLTPINRTVDDFIEFARRPAQKVKPKSKPKSKSEPKPKPEPEPKPKEKRKVKPKQSAREKEAATEGRRRVGEVKKHQDKEPDKAPALVLIQDPENPLLFEAGNQLSIDTNSWDKLYSFLAEEANRSRLFFEFHCKQFSVGGGTTTVEEGWLFKSEETWRYMFSTVPNTPRRRSAMEKLTSLSGWDYERSARGRAEWNTRLKGRFIKKNGRKLLELIHAHIEVYRLKDPVVLILRVRDA